MVKKILIVEDELIEAMNFESFINSSGFDVVGIASTGKDAISKVAELEPDLILMDIVLKGEMDGIEAAAQIHENYDIPVVYLTAHPENSTVQRAKLTSPYGYIIKPVNKIDLKNTIEIALYKHQMENKLKKTETKYRELVDNSMVAVYETTLNGEILFANDAMVKMFDYDSVDDLKKDNVVQIYKNAADREKLIKKIKKDKTVTQYEVEGVTKSGRTFNAFLNAHLLDNTVTGMVIDITELKRSQMALHKSVERFRAVAESAVDGIITTDMNGTILFYNKSLGTIFGYSKNEIVGKKLTILMPERYRKNYINELKGFKLSGEHQRVGKTLKTIGLKKDGTEFPFEMSLSAWKSGKKSFFTSIIRDINEREKAEEIQRIEHDLAIALSEPLEFIETMNICLDAAIKVSKMDSGGLYLVDDNSGDLNLKVHSGLSSDFVANASHYVADSPSARIVMKGNPIYTHYKKLGIPIPKSRQKENIRGMAIIPIQFQGKAIASLNIASHTKDHIPDQYRNALETISGLIGSAIARSKAEDALFQNEKNYRTIFENTGTATAIVDENMTILDLNSEVEKFSGYKKEEIVGKKKWIEFADEDEHERLIGYSIKRQIDPNSPPRQYETIARDRYGNKKYILLTVANIPDTKKKVLSILDITNHKKAENALRRNEEAFRGVVEQSNEGLALCNEQGIIIQWNHALEIMSGIKHSEAIGRPMWNIAYHMAPLNLQTPENYERLKKGYFKVFKTGEIEQPHQRQGQKIILPDGTQRFLEIGVSAIKTGKGFIVSSIVTDITERKKAEEQLKKSLKEKDLLIKEIHHRVKNNLQIISSLLELQETYVKEDNTAVNVLHESQNRVLSMAMIHEMLYQSKDLNHINFSDYIRNLVSNLLTSYTVKTNITPLINVDKTFLNIETSIPLGLIISELISNSLKYAFPDDKTGELSISLKSDNKEYKLIISDNGIGFPEDIDIRNVESTLGLRLVNSLVKQIDGTIKLDRSQGTKYTIKFKEQEYEKRV